jgi:ribosomal protein S18 acetylase RimI-like enzyme
MARADRCPGGGTVDCGGRRRGEGLSRRGEAGRGPIVHPTASHAENVMRAGGRRRASPESHPGTTLRWANWPTDTAIVRRLFEDYRQWLADHRDTAASAGSRVKSGLEQLDQQIAELPGAYGPPRGAVTLAFNRRALVACGALRELGLRVGEIKRIYVRADHRGPGFGPRLTRVLLRRARALGYERVRVDTLPTMTAAIRFYQEMGFHPLRAYWPHPVRGALFFEYSLGRSSRTPRRPEAAPSKRPRA